MEVPVNINDLDQIVYNVALDLIEERAINESIDNITEKLTEKIIDDVIFIIERYMYYINSFLDNQKTIQSKKIFDGKVDFK